MKIANRIKERATQAALAFGVAAAALAIMVSGGGVANADDPLSGPYCVGFWAGYTGVEVIPPECLRTTLPGEAHKPPPPPPPAPPRPNIPAP